MTRQLRPLWTTLKEKFEHAVDTGAERKVTVKIQSNAADVERLFKALRQTKWKDKNWKYAGFTKLHRRIIKNNYSADVVVEITLATHRRAAIVSMLLKATK